MGAGDVPSLPGEQLLMYVGYVGHLKFTPLALGLPSQELPRPAQPSAPGSASR